MFTESFFALSKSGLRATTLPQLHDTQSSKSNSILLDMPLDSFLPKSLLADTLLPMPEVTEFDIVRHISTLATRNMSVDTNFYPLGSCTMKYNPKRNETFAANSAFLGLHPYQNDDTVQGQLAIFFDLQQMLAEIAGLHAVSLQPAAGAHGELTALLVAAAYFQDNNANDFAKRKTILIPDSAHGTNPASAAFAGFTTQQVKSNSDGCIDIDDLQSKLGPHCAAMMITNPNTLGLYERNIRTICKMVHDVGALIYMDGANMNAIAGIVRPGDFGADMMHFNVHKTFSTPHGAGGPGAGPIAVRDFLAPFLPAPIVCKSDSDTKTIYALKNPEKSIGKVRTFFGSSAVLNRTWFYLKTLGPDGLRQMAEGAVLNANYLLALVKHFMNVPFGDRCLHEFVASGANEKLNKGVTTLDIAKRIIDFGIHPPTIYFPLLVSEAIMIEPTETEKKETLEKFAEVLKTILEEQPEILRSAPNNKSCSRPDEVAAVKNAQFVIH
ncbi:MAG: aminomethyl-transferring glycine dehydrogenase subunit GcvPB [Thermoguttaceae bacterium]